MEKQRWADKSTFLVPFDHQLSLFDHQIINAQKYFKDKAEQQMWVDKNAKKTSINLLRALIKFS